MGCRVLGVRLWVNNRPYVRALSRWDGEADREATHADLWRLMGGCRDVRQGQEGLIPIRQSHNPLNAAHTDRLETESRVFGQREYGGINELVLPDGAIWGIANNVSQPTSLPLLIIGPVSWYGVTFLRLHDGCATGLETVIPAKAGIQKAGIQSSLRDLCCESSPGHLPGSARIASRASAWTPRSPNRRAIASSCRAS